MQPGLMKGLEPGLESYQVFLSPSLHLCLMECLEPGLQSYQVFLSPSLHLCLILFWLCRIFLCSSHLGGISLPQSSHIYILVLTLLRDSFSVPIITTSFGEGLSD